MTTESTYQPGDIAMVDFGDGAPAVVAVLVEFGTRETVWHAMDGQHTSIPDEVGPVLGNVTDIAESENQKYETAMDHYAAHTTHGNTWIEENE